MKTLARIAIVAALALAVPAAARADHPEARAAYQEMKQALGVVPSFLRAFPEDAVAAAWEELKGLQLNPRSAIPPKYKELIGLAVSAQIPCRYCTYFHTQAAALFGAGEREIKEAVVMAALTRKWSTQLNGLGQDEAQFKAETKRIFAYVVKPRSPAAPVMVTDAASAYRDIEATLGLVPTFLRAFPASAIAGAWREFKGVQLNPQTALPGKYKELIGLAVAAQIPCRYCVYFHTEAAKLNGANEAEIAEAIAMAGHTRHWSTWLNGMNLDEATFRRETDLIVAYVKKQMK